MGPIPLSFDITDALPAEITQGQRLSIAAWLFFPDDISTLGPKPIVMTLLSGGSYDKRYYHSEFPGHAGYSAAEHLAARGAIVLLPDHLGVGDSSRAPDQKQATRHVVACANDAADKQFRARLRAGDLHPNLLACADAVHVGGGHSLGAMQMITQQAAFAAYDAVMVLGFTILGIHLTTGGKLTRADKGEPPEDAADYGQGSRAYLHETFHWSDVPADLIEADDAAAVRTPAMLGYAAMRTGIVTDDAAKITVPIYICLGERDVSPDPRGEPACYKSSTDISLHILPRSGHCQNFAGTRRRMWDRMHAWARSFTT